MRTCSILASLAVICGLAACDSSSDDSSSGELKASDITGLWYSSSSDTSEMGSSKYVYSFHIYLRLDANSTLTSKAYSYSTTSSLDSSFSSGTWRLSGNQLITTMNYNGKSSTDTVAVSLQGGNLVITSSDEGEAMTQIFQRVNAITTPSVPKSVPQLEKINFTLGSQEQSSLPSLLSIRKSGTLFMKDLQTVGSNVENIDLILYEDFNTVTKKLDHNNTHLWSPKAFAADQTWSNSSLVVNYFSANTKEINTQFAFLDDYEMDDIVTKDDFEDAIRAIPNSMWKTNIDVLTGDVIAINVSGTYAIAKVTSAMVVSNTSTSAASDNKAVHLELLVYTIK